MNAFQLIDLVGKLGLEWSLLPYSEAIRCDGQCPLEKLIGAEPYPKFNVTIKELQRQGISLTVIRLVIRAADGYLHNQDREVSAYRRYLLSRLRIKK